MNLSNHLSMVFRGTTRIPSDCALSFCKRVILWWLLCWKTGGNWRGCRRPSWQTPCSDPSPALSWCMPQYSRGAPAAPPASTPASRSLSGSVPTPCEICLMVSHYRWRQRIQGHHREAARSREKLKGWMTRLSLLTSERIICQGLIHEEPDHIYSSGVRNGEDTRGIIKL